VSGTCSGGNGSPSAGAVLTAAADRTVALRLPVGVRGPDTVALRAVEPAVLTRLNGRLAPVECRIMD
jgi:hypothetical protein